MVIVMEAEAACRLLARFKRLKRGAKVISVVRVFAWPIPPKENGVMLPGFVGVKKLIW